MNKLSFDEIFYQPIRKKAENEEQVENNRPEGEEVTVDDISLRGDEKKYKVVVKDKVYTVTFGEPIFRKWQVKDDDGKIVGEGISDFDLNSSNETFDAIKTEGVAEALQNLFAGKLSSSKKKIKMAAELKELTSLSFERNPDIKKKRFLVELEESLFEKLVKEVEDEGISRNLLMNLLVQYFVNNKSEVINKLKSMVS